jgi:putative redox protein
MIKTKSFELAVNVRGDREAKKVAVILPGRLDSKDYGCFESHMEYLAGKGHFAVCFDPPGTWESPGGIELFTTTNYIKATNEVIEYYGSKPTLLMGHSRGGAVAILAGTNNPLVSGIVVIMANYGAPTAPLAEAIRTGVNTEYRDMPPGTEKTAVQKEFKLPINYFKDAEKYNIKKILKTCTKPKLLFYGKDDEDMNPETVKEIFASIPEPKILHELNCDHDYRYYPEMVEEVNKVTGEFLDTV